jgi:hypothetical protein
LESIVVSIDSKWVRIVRSPAYFIVSALSGVAVTFFPMYMYRFGREGADYTDWRVIACWLTTMVICGIHFRLSAPVVQALRSAGK